LVSQRRSANDRVQPKTKGVPFQDRIPALLAGRRRHFSSLDRGEIVDPVMDEHTVDEESIKAF
jgi:hypothetical protein